MATTDLFNEILKDKTIETISKKTGLNSGSIKSMAQKALPEIISGLQNNSKDSKKADSLNNAIKKDHDGSLFDNIDKLNIDDGKKIISHIFGDKKNDLSKSVGDENVLGALGSLVMQGLGKKSKETGKNPSEIVSNDSSFVKMAKGFLDKDGDGDIKDDLFGIIKKFFSKKK